MVIGLCAGLVLVVFAEDLRPSQGGCLVETVSANIQKLHLFLSVANLKESLLRSQSIIKALTSLTKWINTEFCMRLTVLGLLSLSSEPETW